MDWKLGKSIKNLRYKILQDSNSFIFIGLCHRKVVKAKNFTFSYSGIGHGVYMISSNGGNGIYII